MISFGIPFSFPFLPRKEVALDFEGGDLSSDAGLIPLALADQKLQLTQRLAEAMDDPRDPCRIQHSLHDLFRERIYLIGQGYADCNDANSLRHDPLLKLVVGRTPEEDPLAGQSTLSRFENAPTRRDLERMGQVLLEQFLARCGEAPSWIVLDLDPFVDECHGDQQRSLFHGYYGNSCYLPLYLSGRVDGGRPYVIGALLRDGRAAPTKGARFLLHHVVGAIRARYPQVRILVRGDGGFGVPAMIHTCRHLGVNFLFGKPQNARLHALSQSVQMWAAIRYSQTKQPHREYGEFQYAAGTWKQEERMIVKAEVTLGKLNPRFVVTDLSAEEGWEPETVYALYCERGDAPENRIKEFKVDLSADRLSCEQFVANQFRLLLHVAAYLLIQTLQDGLAATEWAGAQAGTIRVSLLKVAARVIERQRVVRVHLPTSYPWQRAWRRVIAFLVQPPVRGPAGAIGAV